MSGFNLSEWAIRHRSLVIYFMLVLIAAGVASYFRLGRNEDPNFTINTMVVQANWPGATLDDTLKQVTERIERKLQETPGLDYVRSYTTAGQTTIFVNLKGATPAKEVPEIWYQVRKKVGDIRNSLPEGVVGPSFNDEFGDTYGIVYAFTADGFTHRELKDHVEEIRSRLLQVPDVSKVDVLGAQDERIFVEFSTERLAGTRHQPFGADCRSSGSECRDASRPDSDQGREAPHPCNGRFPVRARCPGGQFRSEWPDHSFERYRPSQARLC